MLLWQVYIKINNFSIGEMDLAIADYSKALEIDNKINNKVSWLLFFHIL